MQKAKMKRFWLTRKWTREIREKVKSDRINYNKNLITLASSAILLTFTIIQVFSIYDLVRWLKLSWLFFAFSIVTGIIAHALIIHEDIYWYLSMRTLKQYDKVEEAFNKKEVEFLKNIHVYLKFATLSYFLEILQLVTFLLAIGFLLFFMLINI